MESRVTLALIVEGHGEVTAAPVLLRRIVASIDATRVVHIAHPHRIPRSKLTKPEELARALSLAALRVGPGGRVLVLLDADDDCPAFLGASILAEARRARPDLKISVVVANREYESWFLAGLDSLAGHAGVAAGARSPDDPESIRDAKGRVAAVMQSYSATVDQERLSAVLDIAAARKADSFDKLVRDVCRLLDLPVPPRPTDASRP